LLSFLYCNKGGVKVIKFIKYFIYQWLDYPIFKAYWDRLPKRRKEIEDKGEWFPKNRFDYAWTLTKIRYKHRDQYGHKCKKYNGDCEKCNAKHC